MNDGARFTISVLLISLLVGLNSSFFSPLPAHAADTTLADGSVCSLNIFPVSEDLGGNKVITGDIRLVQNSLGTNAISLTYNINGGTETPIALDNLAFPIMTSNSDTWQVVVAAGDLDDFTATLFCKNIPGGFSGSVAVTVGLQVSNPPNAPTLISPVDGSSTNNNQPSFSWSDESASGATSNHIQVASDSLFSSLVINTEVFGTSFIPGSPLADGAYFARVFALNDLGEFSLPSNVNSFTIDTTAPDTANPITSDGAVFGGSQTLDWNAAAGATQYRLRVYSDAALTTLAHDETLAATTRTLTLGDGTYYWTVESLDALGNTSLPSIARNFTADTTAPDTAIDGATVPSGVGGTPINNGDTTSFNSIRFEGSGTDTGGTGVDHFVCALDGKPPTDPCHYPLDFIGPLPPGFHHFEAKAVDAAGNEDPTPATFDWTVDTTPVPEFPGVISVTGSGPESIRDTTPSIGSGGHDDGTRGAVRAAGGAGSAAGGAGSAAGGAGSAAGGAAREGGEDGVVWGPDIPIELVLLNLVSATPITVDYGDEWRDYKPGGKYYFTYGTPLSDIPYPTAKPPPPPITIFSPGPNIPMGNCTIGNNPCPYDSELWDEWRDYKPGGKYYFTYGTPLSDIPYPTAKPPPPPITIFSPRVNLHSGEFVEREPLYYLPSDTGSLDIRSTYRSHIDCDCSLGHGRQLNFDKLLVFLDNENIARQNGDGRSDVYVRNPDDSFTSPPGFYDLLSQELDGSYKIRDRNGTTEFYNSFGRLVSITDRNGNSLNFEHNLLGQLSTIRDTQNRPVNFTYDAQGRITAITDFLGRQVLFQYDGDGNLASKTETPTTDFPLGTTTSYTYDADGNLLTITDPKGQPYLQNTYDVNDQVVQQQFGAGQLISYSYDELNRQTTVTDGNGNQVRWTYDSLVRPVATMKEEFTRGIRPTDPSVYTTAFGSNPNLEITRVTLPRGNVDELLYDELNPDPLSRGNLLEFVRYPIPPSSEQPIRTTFTHEPFFNGIATITDARGNDPTFVPPNGGANSPQRYTTELSYDVKGNVVEINYPVVNPAGLPHPAFGSQYDSQQATELFEYNDEGQMTKYTDPKGNVIKYEYNAQGYLERITRDFGPGIDPDTSEPRLNLTTEFGYDQAGNVVSIRDGRGHTTTIQYNEKNQPTKMISREPFLFETRYSYDANGNLKRVERPNIDDPLKPFLVDEHGYDELNRLVSSIIAADRPPTATPSTQPQLLTTEYEYDANGNLVRVRSPEAVLGNQPNNQIEMNHDERNLLLSLRRGGDSTYTYNYDANGNPQSHIDGTGDITSYQYDGFDRLVSLTDPLGNMVNRQFDPGGNVVRTTISDTNNVVLSDVFAQNDERGRAYRLDRSFFDVTSGLSLPDGPLTPGDGKVTTLMEPDRIGRMKRAINDNDNGVQYNYDGVGRLVSAVDPLGNSFEIQYDENSNQVKTTEVETSPENHIPNETFDTHYVYNNLDWLIRTTDNLGQTNDYRYDSRGNMIRSADANGPLMPDPLGLFAEDINGDGNTIEYLYDGADRLIEISRDMRTGGTGAGAVIGTIKNSIDYDANSRTVKRTDGKVNPTEYSYDSLNRLIRTTFADGTTRNITYDQDDNPTNIVDQNGSILQNIFDANRLIQRNITPAAGVRGTTLQTFEYDGLSRITRAFDNNGPNLVPNIDPVAKINDLINQVNALSLSKKDKNTLLSPLNSAKKILTDNKPSNDSNACAQLAKFITNVNKLRTSGKLSFGQATNFVNQTATIQQRLGCIPPPSNDSTVTFQYDSLGGLVQENQNGKIVQVELDGLGNKKQITYPGGKIVKQQHDELERVKQVQNDDMSLIASYDYMGPGRVLERTYGNGISMEINYDGARRIISVDHLKQDNSLVQGFGYEYDRMGNRDFESRPYESDGDTYKFNSIYSLISVGTDQTNIMDRSTAKAETLYNPDDANNWNSISRTQNNAPLFDYANSINEMNEYLTFANSNNVYDNNGNLVKETVLDGLNNVVRHYYFTYDLFNRLVQVETSVDDVNKELLARYNYDALNRRIMKQTYVNSQELEKTLFFYRDWTTVEEQDGSAVTKANYVPGPSYLDKIIVMERKSMNQPTFARSYYHQNVLGSVHALTGDSANIVETYRYDPYGDPSFDVQDLNYASLPVSTQHDSSAVGNPYLFTGSRYDQETGQYYNRFRNYDPEIGRFIQRDPIGIWGDSMNLGNPYAYVGNNPSTFQDPFGLNGLREITDWLKKNIFSPIPEAVKEAIKSRGPPPSPPTFPCGGIGCFPMPSACGPEVYYNHAYCVIGRK